MELQKWPMRPDHITNDGLKFDEKSPLRLLNGTGIITNDHLQGIQTSISVRVNCPTTIIELSPNSEPVRTDSYVFDFMMRPPCRKFRELTNHAYCYECDNHHANILLGLHNNQFETEVPKRIKNNPFIQNYIKNPYFSCNFLKEDERGYLEYDCPILGYRELIYPVVIEDKVIAVFFFGQVCLYSKLDFINSAQELFFEKNPRCFNNYISYYPDMKVKDLQNDIFTLHSEWASDDTHVIDDNGYKKLKENIYLELIRFEEILQNQIDVRREFYVRQNVHRIIQTFQQGIEFESKQILRENLEIFWRILEICLQEMVESFSLKFIAIFANPNIPRTENGILEHVTNAGKIPERINTKLYSIKYDLNKIDEGYKNRFISTSNYDSKLFEGFEGINCEWDLNNNVVAIISSPYASYEHVAMLIGYHDWNNSSTIENKSGGFLASSLRTFMAIAFSSLTSISAAISKAHMEKTFRLFSHEVGQLNSGLDFLRITYLTKPKKLRTLKNSKIDDLQRDVDGYLKLIHFLTETATKATTFIPDPVKTEFLPYRELLAKWKDIYRLEAERRSLQFYIPYPPDETEDDRPPIYGDLRQIEQLVFNLVNNAVKYCYRGTKIKMDCKVVKKNSKKPHVITITNYGIQIEEGDQPYELYYRGKIIPQEVEGLGIGLYVAKKIAHTHGGSITHECKKISEFNIPLLESFIATNGGDSDLVKKAKIELAKLKETDKYVGIVALFKDNVLKYSNPSAKELSDNFIKPTWEVTFNVEIPPKENSK